jgi:hypothetical protein
VPGGAGSVEASVTTITEPWRPTDGATPWHEGIPPHQPIRAYGPEAATPV